MVTIRRLTPDDAEASRKLRLRALQDHPEAYGAAYEEAAQLTIEDFAQRLATGVTLGAFDADVHVGTVFININMRSKTQHQARINAMYVAPEARGKGVGKHLIQAALGYLRQNVPQVEDVLLSVAVGNAAAKALYAKMGFVTWGVYPRALKIDGRYVDLEEMILCL